MQSRDVGAYHLSVDASYATLSLRSLLFSWNSDSKRRFSKSLAVISPPVTIQIGGRDIETAMLSDCDGNIIEVLRRAWETPGRGSAVPGAEKTSKFEWEDDGVLRSDVVPEVLGSR